MITIDDIVTGIMQREDRRFRPGMEDLDTLLVNRPADKGGPTLIGATYREYGRWKFGRPAKIEELLRATEDELRAFYAERYVAPFAFVPEPLKILAIDWGVTSGQDDPTKAIQRALRARGVYEGSVDGVAGPKTRAAVLADSDPKQTYRDVLAEREDFYLNLALNDPAVKQFMAVHPKCQLWNVRGWLNRCQEFYL